MIHTTTNYRWQRVVVAQKKEMQQDNLSFVDSTIASMPAGNRCVIFKSKAIDFWLDSLQE